MVFAAMAVVLLLAQRFGRSPSPLAEKRVNGRAYIQHPELGWFGAQHSRSTGVIEGWEACEPPPGHGKPPKIIVNGKELA
jgi:hypothetical protein